MSSPQNETYAQNELIRLYINNVRSGTREDRVDHVWAQILGFYWPIQSNYGIEREPYAAEGAGTRADIVLTTKMRQSIVKCLFVECKRPKSVVRSIDWDNSKLQMERYIERWEERNATRPVWGLACIGLQVRFYIMPAGKTVFQDFKREGSILSLVNDARAIDETLRDIRAILATTYHG